MGRLACQRLGSPPPASFSAHGEEVAVETGQPPSSLLIISARHDGFAARSKSPADGSAIFYHLPAEASGDYYFD